MKILQINIKSKNKNAIKKFIFFFKTLNFNLKLFETKNKKKVLTILKSPHVNKKAQEQFKFNTFSKNFNIIIFQKRHIMIILKLLKTNLFHNIKFNIKFLTNNTLLTKICAHTFNLVNKKQINFFDKKLNIHSFFNKLDIYGELLNTNKLKLIKN